MEAFVDVARLQRWEEWAIGTDRTAEMALAGDGLLADPIRGGAARPLRLCKEGSGRRRRVGIEGSLRARPHATETMPENTPSSIRSGARRDKGWHTTRA